MFVCVDLCLYVRGTRPQSCTDQPQISHAHVTDNRYQLINQLTHKVTEPVLTRFVLPISPLNVPKKHTKEIASEVLIVPQRVHTII